VAAVLVTLVEVIYEVHIEMASEGMICIKFHEDFFGHADNIKVNT
jgi:hypothetical protein